MEDHVQAALERALQECVRSVSGFQNVTIGSATRPSVPGNAPIVLIFRIAVLRACNNGILECDDPFIAAAVAQEFREALESSLADGELLQNIQRQASRRNVDSIRDLSPRPNSANLMSSTSYLIEPNSVVGVKSSAGSRDAVKGILGLMFLLLI